MSGTFAIPGESGDTTAMAREVRSRERDGVGLGYVEVGAGTPAVLLVHGWCCDHRFWREQIDVLARGHRVVAVDLRGHGTSDKPHQTYTMEGFVDDLVWLAGELGLDRPVVVGHSMGGTIATLLAARHPGLARALVLVDPAILVPEDHYAPMRDAMRGPDPKAFAATLIDSFVVESTTPALAREYHERMLATPEHVMTSAGVAIWGIDQWATFRAVQVPILIVSAPGLGDMHRAAPDLNPHARLHLLDCGHFVQLERPAELNRLLIDFLAATA